MSTNGRRRLGSWGLVLASLVVLLMWTGTALAGDPGLVDQYTEQVPTASGPKGTSGGGGPSAPLPPAVQTQIQQRGGADTTKLKEIATSPRFGAPTVHQPDQGNLVPPSTPGALSAAVSAVSDGSNARLIGLFIALVVTAVMMGGTAALRLSRRARA